MEPAPGEASTDVCSAGQVQFARAGSRVLNRKTLAGRDRDLDAVRRVVVYQCGRCMRRSLKGPVPLQTNMGIDL